MGNLSLRAGDATKTIAIVYDKKCYELHLEQQLAIDMSHILDQPADSETDSLFAGLENITLKKFLELTGTIEYDGKDCYEISEKTRLEEAEANRSNEKILVEACSSRGYSESFPMQKAPRHRWTFVVSVNVIVITLLLVLWRMRHRTKK